MDVEIMRLILDLLWFTYVFLHEPGFSGVVMSMGINYNYMCVRYWGLRGRWQGGVGLHFGLLRPKNS